MRNISLLKTSLLLLSISLMVGCSQGKVPSSEIVKKGEAAYFKCAQETERQDLDAASKTCQSGLKAMNGYDHRIKEGLYNILSTIEARKDNYEASASYAKQNAELAARIEGKQTIYYGWALAKQGAAQNFMCKFKEAEPVLTEAEQVLDKEILQKKNTKTLKDYIYTLQNLTISLAGQDKEQEALKFIDKSFRVQGKTHAVEYDHMMAFASLSALIGEQYYAQSQNQQAQKYFEKSIQIYEKYKTQSPVVNNNIGTTIAAPFSGIVLAMAHLGDIYEKNGKTTEAKKLKEDAKEWHMLKTLGAPNNR